MFCLAGGHAREGDIVLNAAAVAYLERLSGLPLAEMHRPDDDAHAAASLLHVGDATVTVASRGCVAAAFALAVDGASNKQVMTH